MAGLRGISLFVLIFSLLLPLTNFADYSFPLIPNAELTSGDLCDTDDPDFKNYRYSQKIPYCSRNVSYETKTQVYESYNIPAARRGEYTVDHLIPLSIGGSNQIDNLWPEHKKVKETRVNLELEVFEDVRDGKMSQAEAIDLIMKVKMDPQLAAGRGH